MLGWTYALHVKAVQRSFIGTARFVITLWYHSKLQWVSYCLADAHVRSHVRRVSLRSRLHTLPVVLPLSGAGCALSLQLPCSVEFTTSWCSC